MVEADSAVHVRLVSVYIYCIPMHRLQPSYRVGFYVEILLFFVLDSVGHAGFYNSSETWDIFKINKTMSGRTLFN